MSKVLIAETKLVEKYKQAIPIMEEMLELGGFYYLAGSLMLNMKDPVSGFNMTDIDVSPINDYGSDTIRKGQYLASLLFVKNKAETCSSYNQAVSNIKEYEENMS